MKSKYVVMNDGQFCWPANAEQVKSYDGDPMSDEGVAACPVPDELRGKIGYGVGSQECIDLCSRLVEEGAEIVRPDGNQ